MRNVAFVFSGGGAKGSFELGCADYLIRGKRENPQVIVGVSTGNLNAAMLAQGGGYDGLVAQLDKLCDIWLNLKGNRDVYYRRLLGIAGLLVKADSVYSNKPLWDMIRDQVTPEALRKSGRLFRIGVVGLKSGDYFTVDGSYARILDMIRASATVPVYFSPVDLDGERWVDGGVRNVTPLNCAFRALGELRAADTSADPEADTMYVILASPLVSRRVADDRELSDGLKIGIRCLELLVDEVYANDLQLALTINEALRYFETVRAEGATLPEGFPFAKYHYVNVVVIEPPRLFMDSLEFDPEKIRTAYEAGKVAAREACEKAAQMGGSNVRREMFTAEGVVLRGQAAAPSTGQ